MLGIFFSTQISPLFGLPNAEEIEVLRAPPPYLAPERPPTEAAWNPLLNLGNCPFGLPSGVRRQPDSPQGTTPEDPPSNSNEITDAELAMAIRDALYPAIRVMNDEVEEFLEATRLPLHHLRLGLTVQQGYMAQQEFYPGYKVIGSLQDLTQFEFDHWINEHRDLVVEWNAGYWHPLEWNLWQDARYPITNSDHTGQHAVVHAVDPADLGLPPQPDGRNILLYAYEGEELALVLEGNGFCFPGLDQCDCFLHFQGDEVLPMQQGYLGVYFPSFPHETTLIELETNLVPRRQYDILGPDPKEVMAWALSPWYCQHWDVP